jgi:hypothetical protein
VSLGVVVFGTHRAASGQAAALTAAQVSSAPSVLIAKPVRTKEGTVLVFVPLDRYQEVTDQMVEDASGAFFNLSQVAPKGSDPSGMLARGQTP